MATSDQPLVDENIDQQNGRIAGRRLPAIAILVLVAGTVLFTNLGGPRLWDRDEPRNAGCAAEMLAANDWITPVFGEELRTHKPVLLYWFMMSAYAMFGVGEFGARFWSAVLGVGTVLLTYGIGRRLLNARAALWGGVILSSTIMFDVAGRAATPDSVLIFFCTLALAIYVWGAFPVQSDEPTQGKETLRQYFPNSWLVVAAMYGVMGIAVLGKGPIGLVIPTAVIGMFLLIMRLSKSDASEEVTWGVRLKRIAAVAHPVHFLKTCWMMRPLMAVGCALAVALPWYLWVGLRTDGEWLKGFFLDHNLHRATAPMEGHQGSVFFYLVAILIGFFPWSIFAMATILEVVRGIRQRTTWKPGFIFLCCWMCVWVGLFTVVKTKLPSYVTPMYPAIALMMGAFFDRWFAGEAATSKLWPRISFGTLVTVGLGIMVALPIVSAYELPGEAWLGAVGLIPLIGGIVCLILHEKQRLPQAGVVMAITAVVFTTTLFAFVTQRIDRHQHIDRLLTTIYENDSDPHIAAYFCREPSWVFYARRNVQFLANADNVEEYLMENPGGFVISPVDRVDEIRKTLPSDYKVLGKAPYFLKDFDFVVLGSPSDERVAEEDAGVIRR